MDRFVAMIWDREDPSRLWQVNSWSETLQRQSPRWIKVLDAPGLRVFSYHHRGDGPIVTKWASEAGIIVGVLFERGREMLGRVRNMDHRVSKRITDSRGDELINKYWGNYLALWRNPETSEVTVLRDPCGAVPCLMTRQQGVEVCFAHAEDVADFAELSFTTDWTFLQAYIVHEYFITKKTGFEEVAEVFAGERIEVKPNGEKTSSWAWNGVEVAAQPDFRTFDDAKHKLRETAEACFKAWGKEYRNVLVMLSGGLDSSIAINLLRHVSDAEIKGLHYVGFGYEEYEVKLARHAAARAGVEMIEVTADPNKEDVSGILDMPRLARPATETIAVLADQLALEVANHVGADGFMNGQAGDALFLQRSAAQHTLSDYLRLRGPRGHISGVAYSAATLQHKSIWTVASDALSIRPWRPHAFLDDPEAMKWRALAANAERTIPVAYRLHPWLTEAARLPPGKAGHLSGILALSRFHPVRGHGVVYDVISSFFCQPIVELVLRTPTYLFCEGGLDRALQRHAFADLIPGEIARRTGKGGISISQSQGMRANLGFFRALILDGALVRQGWLDRAKVERALSPEGVTRGNDLMFIYQLVTAEAWLKSWARDSARAAA